MQRSSRILCGALSVGAGYMVWLASGEPTYAAATLNISLIISIAGNEICKAIKSSN